MKKTIIKADHRFTMIDDFRYLVDVDYDTTSNCEAHGCDSICRCSRLINLKVNKVSAVGYDDFGIKLANGDLWEKWKPSPIEAYCFTRVMAHVGFFDPEKFSVEAVGGYYGEEVGPVSFDNRTALFACLNDLLAIDNDHSRIMYILGLEYGYIADIIKETTKAKLVKRKRASIKPSAGGALMIKAVTEYHMPLGPESVMAVIYQDLVIDGNHRFSYAMTRPDDFEYINVIELS